MNFAIISLTENGRTLSGKLASQLSGHNVARFCFAGHGDEESQVFSSLSALTSRIFGKFDCIVYICACAIAVRMIAPHIRSKVHDPAVLVISDSGEFVIPILSGHLGGANEISRNIANILGTQAVITTASDCAGLFSPDIFARRNRLIIDDMSAAKAVAADIVNGSPAGFISDYPYGELPPELRPGTGFRTGITVSQNPDNKPFSVTLALIPRNIVLGIGCRKGTPAEVISREVENALDMHKIDSRRVCAVSSVDIKADETGLLEFCRNIGVSLKTWSAEELSEVPGDFTSSDFVKKTVGVDNVCERSAVIASGGRLVFQKYSGNAVTVAAAEMPICLDFGRSDE